VFLEFVFAVVIAVGVLLLLLVVVVGVVDVFEVMAAIVVLAVGSIKRSGPPTWVVSTNERDMRRRTISGPEPIFRLCSIENYRK
jgi:hypothetical protein